MKKALLRAAFVALLTAVAAATGSAQKSGPHETEFRAFHADFLKAVAANDKEKIADMIKFPVVTDWSIDTRGNIQTVSINDRAEFIKRYNVLFTPYMRLHAAKAKPQPLEGGRYMLSWKNQDVACSFEFDYIEGTGYRLTAYNIGPI